MRYILSSIILSLFFVFNLEAQRTEIKEAKRSLKESDYYNAARYSVVVLQEGDLSKGQLKQAQKILHESKDKAFLAGEAFTERESQRSVTFSGDETVHIRSNVVGMYSNLIELQELLDNIPDLNRKSVSKKVPDLTFKPRDYSKQFAVAKVSLEEANQLAAEQHYGLGVEHQDSGSDLRLFNAHSEFLQVSRFIADYKDTSERLEAVSKAVAHLKLKEGKEIAASGKESDLETAISLYDEGLVYRELQELHDARELAINHLSGIYYKVAKAYLENKTISIGSKTHTPSEGYGMKAGTDRSTIGAIIIDELIGTEDENKVLRNNDDNQNPPEDDEIKIASIDNHYAALDYLNKLKELNPNFKDVKKLRQDAISGTWLYDQRKGGKSYLTTRIGSTIWMSQNLEFPTANSEYPVWCDQNLKQTIEKQYGLYYTWYDAMQGANQEGSQGICPNGWRIPTEKEFKFLIKHITNGGNYNFQKGGNNQNGARLENSGTCYEWQTGAIGNYWTSTSDKDSEGNYAGTVAYLSTTGFGEKPFIWRTTNEFGEISYGTARDLKINCRCVKDYRPSK